QLRPSDRAGCAAWSTTRLRWEIPVLGIGRCQIIGKWAARSVASNRRNRDVERFGKDKLAPLAIQGVSRLHLDRTLLAHASDRVAERNAPVVQAAVVQPAQLAVERLRRIEVRREQALTVEERWSLQARDIRH